MGHLVNLGETPGEFGTLDLSGSSSSFGFVRGNGLIEWATVLSPGLDQLNFQFTGGSLAVSIFFPLDNGPIQFLESVSIGAGASESLGVLASRITFDPAWKF